MSIPTAEQALAALVNQTRAAWESARQEAEAHKRNADHYLNVQRELGIKLAELNNALAVVSHSDR